MPETPRPGREPHASPTSPASHPVLADPAVPAASPPHGVPGSALPVHWHRRVLTLAGPIILANLTQPILGAVDTAVAGHMGAAAPLGGVALGGLFFNIVFWAFGFLRMGTTGLVAQSHGAGDAMALRANLLRALALAFLIGMLIVLFHAPLLQLGFRVIGGSAAVTSYALTYSEPRIWAAPFALLNYAVLGYLLGCQRVRLALLSQILINAVNIVAVLAYVYGLGRGIAGIGAATATADVCGFLFGAFILWRLRTRGLPRFDWRELVDRAPLRRLIVVNRDIMLRTLCLLTSVAWFAHMGARQGDRILAANALLLNFQTFMAFGLDGFAQAAEALVGAAIGARDRAACTQAIKVALLWSMIGAVLIACVYAAAGSLIIQTLTSDVDVRHSAVRYLPWVVALPIVSALAFLLDGVFIGATKTTDLMTTSAVSLLIYGVAVTCLTPYLGNDGLWLALLILMIARGMTLLFRLPSLLDQIAPAPQPPRNPQRGLLG